MVIAVIPQIIGLPAPDGRLDAGSDIALRLLRQILPVALNPGLNFVEVHLKGFFSLSTAKIGKVGLEQIMLGFCHLTKCTALSLS